MVWGSLGGLYFQPPPSAQLVCIFVAFYSYMTGYAELSTESLVIACLHNLTQWDLVLTLRIAIIAAWLFKRRLMDLLYIKFEALFCVWLTTQETRSCSYFTLRSVGVYVDFATGTVDHWTIAPFLFLKDKYVVFKSSWISFSRSHYQFSPSMKPTPDMAPMA